MSKLGLATRLTSEVDHSAAKDPGTQKAHIRAVDIHRSFMLGSNEVHALRGVSAEFSRGEFVALCGTSGSGKSTLLNILGGLDKPSTGEVIVAGRSIGLLTDDELAHFRAQQLGFVFQTFNLLPILSAVENVEYPMYKMKIDKKERRARAMEALTRVGIDKHADHRPDQLSGGQRQRVAIARAIVHRPEVIIADEPTASLDKKTASEILDLIQELNQKTNITVVVATHDPLVMARAQRQLHISDGVIR